MDESKYARWELERRFLVDDVPDGFELDARWLIEDRYVDGTRLRLRRMRRLDGPETGHVVRKFGQKVVPASGDGTKLRMTNLYLDEAEYSALEALPAAPLRKERLIGTMDGERYGIDLVDLGADALLLATIDFEDAAAMDAWSPASWLGDEVTREERFTGAALARVGPVS
jgi:CYTH domain-containing protein